MRKDTIDLDYKLECVLPMGTLYRLGNDGFVFCDKKGDVKPVEKRMGERIVSVQHDLAKTVYDNVS